MILIPIFVACAAIYALPGVKKDRDKNAKAIALTLFSVFIVSIFAICAAHGFKDVFVQLDKMNLKSALMVSLSGSIVGKIPAPLPQTYVNAIDYLLIKKAAYFTYYLNGDLSDTGWTYYFLEAMALKYPIPLLALFVASVPKTFNSKVKFAEKMMWIPILFIIALFSFVLKVDNGVRYVLPVAPFMIVLAAGRISEMISSQKKFLLVAAILLLSWNSISFLQSPGNMLSYFNEAAGGTNGGRRYLAESNIDWGQNLIRLKNYAETNDMKPLLLYNYGLVPSTAYGFRGGWIPCRPTRAVIAISANYLYGLDPFQKRTKECFSWLNELEPVTIIGGGLLVFDARTSFEKMPEIPDFPTIPER